MKNKKWWGLAAIVLSISLVTACGAKPTTNAGQPEVPPTEVQPDNGAVQDPDQTDSNQQEPDTEEPENQEPGKQEKQEQSITAYVSDGDLMELKSYSAKIQFADDEEKYREALKALQRSDNPEDTPLWAKIEFKSVKLSDGILTVDIHIPDDARLGAGGESFAIEALTKTLFQFDEIKAIDVLVDGQAEESMMGHVTLEHPIHRQ
ncbi:GerMN domain-containing protein [Paenibacillus thiaminolyticus]|uniref:GerMN domain-containing protein n=1 Tax=Paenibacillus thiaminolyticus TaxID=49283 RepID=UPI0011644F27|nr:GerMN domain-containing protein [Paenibacillus thiaminolyticus]NGP56860.1 GerMN domain-containing protein [Paenibacillus thiaminolyticus]WCR27936.1 GerMN domain-containing protein [Paenibacillus thiaminolyticus]